MFLIHTSWGPMPNNGGVFRVHHQSPLAKDSNLLNHAQFMKNMTGLIFYRIQTSMVKVTSRNTSVHDIAIIFSNSDKLI